MNPIRIQRNDRCCFGGTAVTNLDFSFNRSQGRSDRNPIHSVDDALILLSTGTSADHHLVAPGINFQDIQRFRVGNAQTFALTNGVMVNALMLSQNATGFVHYISGFRRNILI